MAKTSDTTPPQFYTAPAGVVFTSINDTTRQAMDEQGRSWTFDNVKGWQLVSAEPAR